MNEDKIIEEAIMRRLDAMEYSGVFDVALLQTEMLKLISQTRQSALEEAMGVVGGMRKALVDEEITLAADDESVPEELLKRATPVIYNQALSDTQESIRALINKSTV
jgi:hypothetical protein